jgi:hypothetical protein
MTSLLRIKPWLLFVFIIMPLVFQIVTIADGIMTMAADEGPEQDEMLFSSMIFLALTFIAVLVSIVIVECWLYALATRLHTKLPPDHQLKLGRFRFAFFFPIFYLIAVLCFMWFAVQSESPALLFFIFPFHFFAMGCIFYVLYFVAKSLKTVELQRRVEFGDYAGEFFLIWFFFVGVWIIQPRVNALFASDEKTESSRPVNRYLK